MVHLDTLEVQYDRKVQLDQFEPITVGAVATFTLENDDDPSDVFGAGQEAVQEMVERELVARIALKKMDEIGPSVPKVKAVIREHTEVLSDDEIESIASEIVGE